MEPSTFGPANFERTGGIHAAGLFDSHGSLLVIREDIGRHNAVDKVLGAGLVGGLPLAESIMMVSGRLGFEIAQKALVGGVPIVASIFMIVHFWRVRKDGGISGPAPVMLASEVKEKR